MSCGTFGACVSRQSNFVLLPALLYAAITPCLPMAMFTSINLWNNYHSSSIFQVEVRNPRIGHGQTVRALTHRLWIRLGFKTRVHTFIEYRTCSDCCYCCTVKGSSPIIKPVKKNGFFVYCAGLGTKVRATDGRKKFPMSNLVQNVKLDPKRVHDGGICFGHDLINRGPCGNLVDSYTENNMGHVSNGQILRGGPAV